MESWLGRRVTPLPEDDPKVTRLRGDDRIERQAAEIAATCNIEAEQALLGALLIDNRAYSKVARLVRAEDFSSSANADIYQAIGQSIAAGREANPVLLAPRFAGDERLVSAGGGAKYLAALAGCAITVVGAQDYAGLVSDLAIRRRQLIELDDARQALLADHSRPGAEILRRYRQRQDERALDANGAIAVYDAGDIDPAAIPPRGWLLGVSFARKFISGVVSEGGAGKTAVRYAQYLAAASGRSITKEHVHVRSRVLIACFEDDLAEVQRRIAAAMLHHGVSPNEIRGWLHYCVPRGLKLLATNPRNDHDAIAGELHTELRRVAHALKIDLVSIDPFVKAHGVSENDNNLIDQVCTMLAGLADDLDVAVDLVSHARKGGTNPNDADRDRGASAKRDAGRLMRNLTTMSPEEAQLYQIEERERHTFARLDDAKVNITPHSASGATWFKLIGVPLGNRTETYPNGDEVQTAERWFPPDAFAALDFKTIDEILNRIEAGPYPGGRYSPSPRAVARSAPAVIQEFLPETPDKLAKHIIATWIKSGVLVIQNYVDPKDRHECPGLFIGKRPGDTWNML